MSTVIELALSLRDCVMIVPLLLYIIPFDIPTQQQQYHHNIDKAELKALLLSYSLLGLSEVGDDVITLVLTLRDCVMIVPLLLYIIPFDIPTQQQYHHSIDKAELKALL